MKALVRRFLREEKTARVFVLAGIVSAVVWVFSSVVGVESFKAFGVWGLVWNWLLFCACFLGPAYYREVTRTSTARMLGEGLMVPVFAIAPLFLFALISTRGEGATSDLSKSVWQVTLVVSAAASILMFGGLYLIAVSWLCGKAKKLDL